MHTAMSPDLFYCNIGTVEIIYLASLSMSQTILRLVTLNITACTKHYCTLNSLIEHDNKTALCNKDDDTIMENCQLLVALVWAFNTSISTSNWYSEVEETKTQWVSTDCYFINVREYKSKNYVIKLLHVTSLLGIWCNFACWFSFFILFVLDMETMEAQKTHRTSIRTRKLHSLFDVTWVIVEH